MIREGRNVVPVPVPVAVCKLHLQMINPDLEMDLDWNENRNPLLQGFANAAMIIIIIIIMLNPPICRIPSRDCSPDLEKSGFSN